MNRSQGLARFGAFLYLVTGVGHLNKKRYVTCHCEFTGKGPMSGNNVSHATTKQNVGLPNLNDVTLQSEALGRGFKFRISAAALRSVDHRGGLDAFLEKAKDSELSANAES